MSLCRSVIIAGILLGMGSAGRLSPILCAQDTIKIGNSFELGKMHLFYDFSDVNRALAGAGIEGTLSSRVRLEPYVNSLGAVLGPGSHLNLSAGLFVLLDAFADRQFYLETYGLYGRFTRTFTRNRFRFDVGGSMGMNVGTLSIEPENHFSRSGSFSSLLSRPDSTKTVQSTELYVGPAVAIRYMIGAGAGVFVAASYPFTLMSVYQVNHTASDEGFGINGTVGLGISLSW